MPSGGARKNAGRPKKSLEQKILSGNPGQRPLTRIEFPEGGGEAAVGNQRKPPEYLYAMEKKMMEEPRDFIPSPVELYTETVDFLEPTGCLHLIHRSLIADYVLAKYHLIQAQYELSLMANVGVAIKKFDDDDGESKAELDLSKNPKLTDFVTALEKLQKLTLSTWEPIWDIVKNNSVKVLPTEREQLVGWVLTTRGDKNRTPLATRTSSTAERTLKPAGYKKKPKGVDPYA